MAERKAPGKGAFSILSILSIKVFGFKLSSILLAILAVLGALPLLKVALSYFIAEPTILSTAAIILSAVGVYYLLLAETNNEFLRKHSMAFVVTTVLVILLAYMYVPPVRTVLSRDVSETIGQVVTMLVSR